MSCRLSLLSQCDIFPLSKLFTRGTARGTVDGQEQRESRPRSFVVWLRKFELFSFLFCWCKFPLVEFELHSHSHTKRCKADDDGPKTNHLITTQPTNPRSSSKVASGLTIPSPIPSKLIQRSLNFNCLFPMKLE